MNRRICGNCFLFVCLLAFMTLAGCGGDNNSNNGNNSGNTGNGGNGPAGVTRPGSTPEHLYWANPTSGNIIVFTVDLSTGALTQSTTVQTGFTTLFAISSDPDGKFLYASGAKPNASTAVTIGYSIDKTTGNLTQIPGSPFDFGVFLVNTVNNASFLYGADNITNQIHTIAIDSSTGALTRLVASTSTGGDNPYSPRLNDARHLLAVANQTSNTISVFTVDASSGVPTLAPSAPFPVNSTTQAFCPPKGGCGSDVAFVNDNLYFGSAALGATSTTPDGNSIFGFSLAGDGVLTPLSSSPFPNLSFAPQTLAATQNGRNLYAANAGGGVVGYNVGGNGALTLIPGNPPNGSGYVAIDPQSKFLYAGDTGHTNGIVGYTIDQNTGALTPIAGATVGAGTQGGQIVIR